MPREEIRAQFGELRDILGGGWLHLAPGDITDDTQMMLCIAVSITEQGGFEPDDIAARFAAWYHSNPPDIGNTTRRSIQYFVEGRSWEEAALRTHEEMKPRDASNGSVMRCAPVALYARHDLALNETCSALSSRITHANPLSVDGTVALNAAIAALLDNPEADALAVAIRAAREPEMREALEMVRRMTPDQLPASGYVIHTLQAAFWALTTNDDLEETIVAAVNLGADADTTGAVAGALAGAKWGMDAIPGRWLDVLMPHDELVGLADQLLALSLAGD